MNNFIINDIKNLLIKTINKTSNKYEIYKLECYLKELYSLVGEKVYQQHSTNKTITDLKLDEIFLHIHELKTKISNINNNRCFKCNYKIQADEIFCPICGYKLNT